MPYSRRCFLYSRVFFFVISAGRGCSRKWGEATAAQGERQPGREAGCQQAAHTKREASGCGKYRVLWVLTVRCCTLILHGRASNIFSRGAQGCCPLGAPNPDMLLFGAFLKLP